MRLYYVTNYLVKLYIKQTNNNKLITSSNYIHIYICLYFNFNGTLEKMFYSVYSYIDDVVEEGDKENQSDFALRRSVRRKKTVNIKDVKMLARGGELCSKADEISCSNVDYFVEFPREELGDNVKRSLSGETQKVLVDNMKEVNLRKSVAGRIGKKARAGGLNRESVVSGKKVCASKEAVIIEKKFSVLNEVKRWELGDLSNLTDCGSSENAVSGNFSFNAAVKEVCVIDEGCSGWPKAATKEV